MIRYFNGFVLFPLLEKKAQRDIYSKLRELKSFETLSRDQQLERQRQCFYDFLLYCQNEVPYYKDLFKQEAFDVEKVKVDIRHIESLPLLTKDIIREQADRIKMPIGHHVRKTGGSTGQSVHFYYDDVGLDWTSAINMQAYDMAGNFVYRKDCHISSELGIASPTGKAKFLDWLKLFSQNRTRLMISSFSDDDLQQTFLDLKTIKPYLLQGHPSSAYAIAEYVARNNLPLKKYCSVFEPSGEMLTPKMVASIEKNLGAKVVNRYGNAEFGVMAHSLLRDSYTKLKIFERAFHIEHCEADSLIVSNCTNLGMPLLRYDTGDVGTVLSDTEGTFITDIQGRVHDVVNIAGEGYATHFIMDYLDHKIRHVREFQIEIKPEGNPLISIVPENENDKERIKSEMLKRWPSGLDIRFITFENLKKVGWRQKFRHVINAEDVICE